MSLSVNRAKYTGDPGLFGDIWSGIKGVANIGLQVASTVPVFGAAAGIARNVLFPGDARVNIPGASTLPSMPTGGLMPRVPLAGPGGVAPNCPGAAWRDAQGQCRTDRNGAKTYAPGYGPAPGILALAQRVIPGGETGMMVPIGMNGATEFTMRAGKASGWPGYHWNKSDYFLRSGEFVPAGTRSVRNRRRNPANPRATSNAIGRIKGAKRYAKSLSAITIRSSCPKKSKH